MQLPLGYPGRFRHRPQSGGLLQVSQQDLCGGLQKGGHLPLAHDGVSPTAQARARKVEGQGLGA